MKFPICIPKPYRVLLTCLALALLGESTSLAAQSSRTDSTKVTAYEVFFACRDRQAFTDDTLRSFCTLRLPFGRPETRDSLASRWATVQAPDPRRIQTLSRSVQARVASTAHGRLAASRRLGPDLAEGLISDTTSGQSWPELVRRATLTIEELRAVFPTDTVVVIQYGGGRARADSVVQALAREGVLHVALRQQAREEPEYRAGSISIHIQMPVLGAGTIRPLEAIRFAAQGTEPDLALLAAAADEIRERKEYQFGSSIQVIGYGVPGDSAPALAVRRAEALKQGLVSLGIDAARIVTDTAARPREAIGDAVSAVSQAQGRYFIQGLTPTGTRAAAALARSSRPEAPITGWEDIAIAATDAILERAELEGAGVLVSLIRPAALR